MLISDKLLTKKRNNDKWVSLSERQNNHKYVCPQQHSIKTHEEKNDTNKMRNKQFHHHNWRL